MRASDAHPGPRSRTVSRTDAVILATGLVAAVCAGVAAYRAAGMYGDGFLNYGLYRYSESGSQVAPVIRRVRTDDGLLLDYVFQGGTRSLIELRVMPPGTSEIVKIDLIQGVPGRFDIDRNAVAWDAAVRRVRIGFALGENGTLDAWQYWGADGQLEEIRLSRRRDGVVDRWEHYDQGQLARVEEDTNQDGRVDRWMTYDAGILTDEEVDRDGDGRRDPREIRQNPLQ